MRACEPCPKQTSWQLVATAAFSLFRSLQPNAQHLGDLFETVRGAGVGRVGQLVPVGVVEIDDIDRRDADLLQSQVIVLHLVTVAIHERLGILFAGDAPDFVNELFVVAVLVDLKRKLQVLACDHVEEDGG